MTITEARAELAKLQIGGIKAEDKDITLSGAFELWKIKAKGQDFSPVTINNTEQHMNMIYQFLPGETKLKDITEEVYYKFCSEVRDHGYADETLRSINATLCYYEKNKVYNFRNLIFSCDVIMCNNNNENFRYTI